MHQFGRWPVFVILQPVLLLFLAGIEECPNTDPENCTDGIDNDGDGLADCEDGDCSQDGHCTAECGDGLVSEYEQCDDGNPSAGDGCSDGCKLEDLVEDPATGISTIAGFKVDALPYQAADFPSGVRFSGGSFGEALYVLTLSGRLDRWDNQNQRVSSSSITGSTPNGCGGTSYYNYGTIGMGFSQNSALGDFLYLGTVNNVNPCDLLLQVDSSGAVRVKVQGSPGVNELADVWSLAVSTHEEYGEYLYIALGEDDGIARMSSDGQVTTFSSDTGPLGIAFAPGNLFGTALYAADTLNGSIVRVAPNGSKNLLTGGMSLPRDLTWGPGGAWGEHMYVVDPYDDNIGTARVYQVLTDGTYVPAITGLNITDKGSGQLAIGSTSFCHSMYIADQAAYPAAPRIVRITPPSPTCGNNVQDACETCDDGNRIDGDGCSAGCWTE